MWRMICHGLNKGDIFFLLKLKIHSNTSYVSFVTVEHTPTLILWNTPKHQQYNNVTINI